MKKELKYYKLWLYWKQSEHKPDDYADCSGDFAEWLDKKEEQELINISKNLQVECLIFPNGSRYHEKCPAPNFERCDMCRNAHYFIKRMTLKVGDIIHFNMDFKNKYMVNNGKIRRTEVTKGQVGFLISYPWQGIARVKISEQDTTDFSVIDVPSHILS